MPSSQSNPSGEGSEIQQQFSNETGMSPEHTRDAMQWLQKAIEEGLVSIQKDKKTTAQLREGIEQIDRLLSAQMAEIMHAPELRQVEGAWRGLHKLVDKSALSPQIQVHVLNASKERLADSFESATSIDKSLLWRMVYSEEFDMAGGRPYGAMIGDFQFDNTPKDLELLRNIGTVAQAAHCPFVSSPSPRFFGLKSFDQLRQKQTSDLPTLLAGDEYIGWNALRESPVSKYIVMAMPQTMERLPYAPGQRTTKGFNFDEVGKDSRGNAKELPHDSFCWSNAAYSVAYFMNRSIESTGWCTWIRGEESGGQIEGLPVYSTKGPDGVLTTKPATEVEIPFAYEATLSKLGFMPLIYHKRSDKAVIYGGETLHKPKERVGATKEETIRLNKNLEVGKKLPNVLAAGQLAQWVMKFCYQKIGGPADAKEMEKKLNDVIASRYVCSSSTPSIQEKFKFQFAAAEVRVVESERAGYYEAIVKVTPFDTFEGLDAAVELHADLGNKQGNSGA